jgi:phosphatidylglycerophosphate synthase
MAKGNSKNYTASKERSMSASATKEINMGAFALGKKNAIILGIGIAFIVGGFLLMQGGGSEDPNVFNPEIFSTQRITIAPIIVLIGFAINTFAIMKRFRN